MQWTLRTGLVILAPLVANVNVRLWRSLLYREEITMEAEIKKLFSGDCLPNVNLKTRGFVNTPLIYAVYIDLVEKKIVRVTG